MLNPTFLSLVRSTLCHKFQSKYPWSKALSTVTYVRNRVTSRSLPSGVTPHHLWKHQTPISVHLRVFGSKFWYVLPQNSVKKNDSRSTRAIFVVYSDQSNSYKLLDFNTCKLVISRDLVFDKICNYLN